MSYKLLYIEDLDPSTIMKELEGQGFIMSFHEPVTFENTIDEIIKSDIDAILIDFRLTSGKARFDAPTIAQTIRTKSSIHHKFIPIFLTSSEDNISDYYKDFTSHDLFDITCRKDTLLGNVEKYSRRYVSFIEAYKVISQKNYELNEILNVSKEKFETIDYRVCEKLQTKPYHEDVYAISNFIYKEIIKSIGILIGEDVLSARLGVNKKSLDWENLLVIMEPYKYKGIFSDSFNRWWANDIEEWWKSVSSLSLRRLNSLQRVEILKEVTHLDRIDPIEKIEYAYSTNFWTICKWIKTAIDPIDGLELHQRELLPWQEKEYLSILAALKGSPLFKYVKPVDKKRYQTITQNA